MKIQPTELDATFKKMDEELAERNAKADELIERFQTISDKMYDALDAIDKEFKQLGKDFLEIITYAAETLGK